MRRNIQLLIVNLYQFFLIETFNKILNIEDNKNKINKINQERKIYKYEEIHNFWQLYIHSFIIIKYTKVKICLAIKNLNIIPNIEDNKNI